MTNLTPKETAVIRAVINSDFGDSGESTTWLFDVSDKFVEQGFDRASFSGAVSSTNKKGLTKTQENVGDDDFMWLTDAGREAAKTLSTDFQAEMDRADQAEIEAAEKEDGKGALSRTLDEIQDIQDKLCQAMNPHSAEEDDELRRQLWDARRRMIAIHGGDLGHFEHLDDLTSKAGGMLAGADWGMEQYFELPDGRRLVLLPDPTNWNKIMFRATCDHYFDDNAWPTSRMTGRTSR